MENNFNDLSKKLAELEKRVEKLEKENCDCYKLDSDPLFPSAVKVISGYDHVSASFLQRRLAIGYARAARLLDLLEEKKLIGKAIGSKPRVVIKQ